MSLFRQVIKQLFRHDQEHTQELLSLSNQHLCVYLDTADLIAIL